MISVPPARLRASPIEDTVTSIRSPTLAEGGSTAVTITTATLRLLSWSSVTLVPRRLSTLRSAWRVTALRRVSPDPARPVTKP